MWPVVPEFVLLEMVAAKVANSDGIPRELRDALAALTTAVEANPKDAEAWVRRGAVLQGLGRPAEALADLRAALEREPGHARAWLLVSEVLPALGEFDGGRAARAHAIQLDPAVAR